MRELVAPRTAVSFDTQIPWRLSTYSLPCKRLVDECLQRVALTWPLWLRGE